MDCPSPEPDAVNALAEEFVARFRRGERPSLSEYTQKHPELAEEIRELFPALVMMEDLGSVAGRPAMPQAGPLPQQLGDFRILRKIGHGGMGVVYEAVQESLGRHVALKVLPFHALMEPTLLERFRREARAVAQLHHTNIVPVFGIDEHEGIPYYAMQFIQGQSLDEVINEVKRLRHNKSPLALKAVHSLGSSVAQALLSGRFQTGAEDGADGDSPLKTEDQNDPSKPVDSQSSVVARLSLAPDSAGQSDLTTQSQAQYFRSVARVGIQVAEALAYAHGHGIVHRDIKPSNLLLDLRGTVWITDFGLAKAEGSDELTNTGDVVGTVRYMSPQRLDGKSEPRSDIYSLGITLYELVTLQPAYADSNRAQLIQRIVREQPPRPRRLDPHIPRDLETIILKAIAKEPSGRYATAEALAEDLRLFVADRPIRARRIYWPEHAWRWCRRNPTIAGLAAAVTSLLFVIAVGSSLTVVYLRTTLTESEANRKAARLELGKSLLAQGAALQRTGLVGQRFRSLDLLAQAARELREDPEGRKHLPEIRDHAITALGLTDLRTLWDRPLGVVINRETPQCDYQLLRYAFVNIQGTGEIVVRWLDDDRELLRLPHPGVKFWHSGVDFSPDGQYLLACYWLVGEPNQLLHVWHLGRKERLFTQPVRCGEAMMAAAIHPNGRWLLFPRPEGVIVVWDLEARREVKRLALGFRPYSICIDPAGKRVAVNNADVPLVKILELETGQQLASWNAQVGVCALAWSGDGQLLASGSGDRVYVWHVERGELASVLQGHTSGVLHAQFAHAGYLLATWSWDATTRLWDAASGEALVTAAGSFWRFSADDRRLVFLDGTKIGTWEVADGRECRILHHGMIGNRTESTIGVLLQGGDFSPDGRLLSAASTDGVRLWEVETGRELAHLKTGTYGPALLHLDGQSLITNSPWGLYRWPIRPVAGRSAHALQIGPPQFIRESSSNPWQVAWMPGHRGLMINDNTNARVLLVDLNDPTPATSQAAVLPSEHGRMTMVAVSPDGQWIASGGWKERSIQIWNVATRRLERCLPPCDGRGDTQFYVAFSADGRWLVCAADNKEASGYYFWRVGTWERELLIRTEPDIPRAPAFTRDGRLMALRMSSQQILLADPANGRAIARLSALHTVNATPLSFSSDGSKLAVVTAKQGILELWDLRRVRDRLKAMGLDWDRPDYEEKPPRSDASRSPPLEVQVLGEVLEPKLRRQREITALTLKLWFHNPFDAETYLRRGWEQMQQHNWAPAIVDLEAATRLRPDLPGAQRLLGEAYLLTGKREAALAALSKHLERTPADLDSRLQCGKLALALAQPQSASKDLTQVLDAEPDRDTARSYRARAHLQLGKAHEAIADIDWLLKDQPRDFFLHQLRADAQDRLGNHARALADRQTARALCASDPQKLNDLAWRLVTGPLIQRDPERALPLAQLAVEQDPQNALHVNTLGVVEYRLGRYPEALATLTKSLKLGQGQWEAFDLFFLALCHAHLGDDARARERYDRAVRWVEQNHGRLAEHQEELDAFRAEAEAVLAHSTKSTPPTGPREGVLKR
jgi:serine/threonine protein kinase/WD40 repeat protein/tetratricopeptide (TPR) repeat protein